MRTSTIWESASRPLFVRTVWLEGSELRPGLQRHFLLDYETKRPSEHLKLSCTTWQRKRKANCLESGSSFDWDTEDEPPEDDLILLGSAKAKLHEPPKPGTAKSLAKSATSRRRPSILSRKFFSYDYNPRPQPQRRPSNTSEFISRRSSLQDISICDKSITPDEKLAERVLNWLDLAGNEHFMQNLRETKDMEVKLTKTAKLRNDSIKRCLNRSTNNSNTNLMNVSKLKTSKLKSVTLPNPDNASAQKPDKNAADAVKHITIIFDKEGQPIRFNRPAKNIDLCALSTSPSTARRLAGSLASARLYKSAEGSRLHAERLRSNKLEKSNKSSFSARKRLDTIADLTTSNLQKRLHESPAMGSFHCLHDSRKQLHIFMPTLPKRGIATLGCGTEDGLSELSQNLSEYCRV